MTGWSGRRVTQMRAYVAANMLPGPCGQCGEEVRADQRWVVGHVISRWERPDLMWDVTNVRPEHRACSDSTGQASVIAKAKAEALAQAGFSPQPSSGQSPPLPFSPSPGHRKPLEVRKELQWANHTQNAPTWLQAALAVPQDASPPLAMTPVHPESVGTYGLEAILWIESELRIELRWWQKLALMRIFEHRLDGSLCWRQLVVSCPRRAGKSILLKGLALFRMGGIEFGEVQTVVHTGSDMAICREIQRQAWRWAEEDAEWTVTRSNGKEAIESEDGDRWLVRAESAVFGYDLCLGLVDEAWDVKPDTVSEGLEPAMLERRSPQLLLTSTAHRRATSLMRKRISAALAEDDGETLLLLWGARPQDDISDPDVWRAASPHWSQDRAKLIASKYGKAVLGEQDPELDDPDPVAGFTSQFLNVWQLNEAPVQQGNAVIRPEEWAELADEPPFAPPDAAAIESWFTEGVSLALAWKVGERAVVSVSDHQDLAGAREALKESGFKGAVTVGSSLMRDPALKGLRMKSGEGRTAAAVQQLGRLLSEDTLRHDGTEHLTTQVLAVRTMPGADGPRMVSKGRADAVKAAVWALRESRLAVSRKPRILLPTGT